MASTADRLLALRDALKLTQQQVATAGGMKHRTDYVKVEKGQNAASSNQMRAQLARGFAIARPDLDDYLDEKITLEEVLRRRGTMRPVEVEELPEALAVVLASAEGRTWSAMTLGALRGAWTASRDVRTEADWLKLGRAYEMGAIVIGRVIANDPVEEHRAARKARRVAR